MPSISDYLENAIINHVLRNISLSSPVTVYVALFTSDPTDANTGTEVSGGSYARQAVSFNVPVNGQTMNSDDIEFPVATADWGTITHVGIMDDETGGNLLFYEALEIDILIKSGDPPFRIPAGELIVNLD